MKLDTIERRVQEAGAISMAVLTVAIVQGYLGGTRREKGLTTEGAPALSRAILRGSPAMLAPMTGLALWLLRLLWRPIRLSLSERVRLFCLALGSLLYFPGVGLMLWGRITLGKMHNVSSATGAQLYANHRLITSGPFRLMRHPMYVGGIMVEAGGLLLYRTWATALITLNALSLPLRARREEELLSARFGVEWEEYARRVPAWIPEIGR